MPLMTRIPDDYILKGAFTRRGTPVTGRWINRAVDSCVRSLSGTDVTDRCDDLSEALSEDLDLYGIPNRIECLNRVPYRVLRNKEGVKQHCVVTVGRYVIDMTAQQFNPNLPVPLIWSRAE